MGVEEKNIGTQSVVTYETDEDEFWRPEREIQDEDQAQVPVFPSFKKKKLVKKSRQAKGYQLAYFSLWWSRMTRECLKEQEEKKSRMERDQHRALWTTWTNRPEQINIKTNVIHERPLDMRSTILTDVNKSNLMVRETTQFSGENIDREGVVHVGSKQVFVNRTQPTTLSTVIMEQHQGDIEFQNCTLNTGTGASLAVALEGVSGDK